MLLSRSCLSLSLSLSSLKYKPHMFPTGVLVAIVLGLLGAAWYFLMNRQKGGVALAAPTRTGGGFRPQPAAAANAAAAGTAPEHRQVARVAAAVEQVADDEDEEPNDDDEPNAEAEAAAPAAGNPASRFHRKKADKQQEKEQRRQHQQQLLEEQRAKRAAELQDALDSEAAEALRLAKEEAALGELRAEKKLREDEDYKKWVSHIEVAEKGEVGSVDAAENALREYLAAVAPTESKLLVLDDCAKRHNLAVERLLKIMNDMIDGGSISGVFDDRGKFVYVTDDEYGAIAKFIRNRGRVAMSELVRECNRIVAA